ncbi:acyltransferase [Paenibacillus doosanensis]|uniref:acyltransferase n=1 Tax=Paenibacillus doosanensis TaxID=1229154 RepID=UPI002180043D|nr:acyltransferase [Paenibacillus doosanensis]MCS7463623.1 acyltransferase [Paenibacillus doosanensis]
MKKAKLLELDIVRAIAILAVLIIHNSSEATVEIPVGSGSQALYLAVNKLSNFAVPVFIFISGLVLFYRYFDDWSGKKAVTFYLKRVKQVLFPYLIWSAFYYVYNQWIYAPANLHFDWAEFGDLLPWADASYHLYFMVIIVQFYLLFPLMVWLSRAFAWFGRSLFLIGILVQAGGYLYSHWIEPLPHSASLCVTYFSLFALGGYLGMRYEAFIGWINKHIVWVLPLSVLLGCSYAGMFLLAELKGVQFGGLAYMLVFNVYPMFASMSFIWIGRLLLKYLPALSKMLLSLGAVSFGIYLMHPAVLTYWRTHVDNGSGRMLDYHLYTLTAFVLSLGVPWLAAYLYGQAMRRLRPPSSRKQVKSAA